MGADAAAIAALRLQLIDGGWRPVPASPADKSCYVVGWPEISPTEFHVENWTYTHPAQTLTSLVCGRDVVGIDVDVFGPERANLVQQVAFRELGVTGFVRVGRAPKFLLVYRQAWWPFLRDDPRPPPPPPIRSESYRFADSDELIEILSQGRLFVAFGIHPDTHLPYCWTGDANPLEDKPTEAPLVTQEQMETFIAAVHAEVSLVVDVKTGKPSASDAPRTINAEGLITNGRENFLRDCVWKAAHEIDAAGELLSAGTLAAHGWELFTAGAWLGDGKWHYKHALEKARGTLRRLQSGRIKLPGKFERVPRTYPGHNMNVSETRAAVLMRMRGFIPLIVDAAFVKQERAVA